MSPYIAFILGGFAGALVYKVIYDSVAKRKRSAFIKGILEAGTELVKSLGVTNEDNADAEDNNIEITNVFSEVIDTVKEETAPKN